MKKLLTIAVALCLQVTAAQAVEWTPENIAQLPQDKVQQIVKDCEHKYPNASDSLVQLACEDSGFDALSTLATRHAFLKGLNNDWDSK